MHRYNADFDGDEMNIFAPQSIEAQIELEEIADLKLQIITPQSSSPIIAMKQDQLLGTWNLTKEYYKLDWRTTMNFLSGLELDKFDNIARKEFTGKEIFSYLIPKKINLLKGNPSNPKILVKNGILEAGLLGDDALGVKKKNSLVQLVWDEYGVELTKKFLDNTTKLTNSFNMYHGMTIGIGDLYIPDQMYHQMTQLFDSKKLEIQHEITELENNPEMMNEILFETSVNSKLAVIRDDVSKLIIANTPGTNMCITMMDSGAKGKAINLAQMAGCVGQQDFHGGRMKKNYNERSLPYFFKNDDRAESRGFIEKPFMRGLNLTDFIFHHLSAREGLIDQTVRSVSGDTKIVIIENSKPKIVEIGPWIDSQIDPVNLTNPELITRDKNNFELLDVKQIQIPTVDEIGNVTWADVTAITRHDPGLQLFEIVTKSGRKVIVPESKSLLIWNEQLNKFEDKLTPNVVLGDKVPITMNLPEPPILTKYIDMVEYFPKNEYIYGTDFIKAKEEMNKAMENRDKIPAGWWTNSNGINFTLPYESKARFQRVLSGRSDISNIKPGYFYSFSTSRDSSIPEKFELDRINGQFIGLFLADGNVDFESGYIQITKSNQETLKFVENYFKSMGINYKQNKRTTERGTIEDIRGYSRILCKFLDLICGHGAINKKIPEFSYTAPEEFIVGLIDGFISGDGSIDPDAITAASCSEKLIDGLNILFAKLGIFAKKSVYIHKNDGRDIKANYNSIIISIRSQWVHKFKLKIKTLVNGNKNIKLQNIKPSEKLHPNFQSYNDVILDKIIEINPIEISKYKKLYDLTIPSTYNFIIFNGMGVRDTAESGYIQRKLIKATEDMMVNYDGTVRNAVGRILQFQYGDSGADTVKQYEYNFKLMEMGNDEIKTKYSMTKEELEKVKEWTESDDKDFVKLICNIRDNLRKTQVKATLNSLTLSISYMLPVNLYRIIDNFRNDETMQGKVCAEPKFIMGMIREILEPYNTRLYCLTPDEMKNKKSVKYQDDQVAKTALGYALTDILAPKKCVFQYKLSKEQLEGIKKEIIKSFNKSIVEPGEMVGIVAAQSLGEPVTQLMLNSLDWEQEIMVHNKKTSQDQILPIGKFIDELIELNKEFVTNPIDNLEAEMKDIFYLETKNMDYYIKSVDEDGKVSWKNIEAITKHLPINKDGTNTLIEVKTRTGKTVVATKGKSFLTQKNNKIIPIRGDEIGIGDYLPVSIMDEMYYQYDGTDNTYQDDKTDNTYHDEIQDVIIFDDQSDDCMMSNVKLLTAPNKYSFTRKELIEHLILISNDISLKFNFCDGHREKILQDMETIKYLITSNIFMDEIISIIEVKPTHTYVYDLTVADTKNFVISNGLCMRDSFHASGVGGKGGTNIGVDRIKEVFSLSKNPKEPEMEIYFDQEHRSKKDFANKIASYIKFTTIKDLRTKIEILYDPNPYNPNGYIVTDNIGVPFYTYQSNKQCCSNSIDGLPWLMRIEFDREKLLNKEVSLLDIKSQFCFAWEKRYTDIKSIKREKRQLIDKITQLAVLSNTDNDDVPILHIRFDMTNFTQSTLVDFMDLFVDEFKLKGMAKIEDIRGGGKAFEERIISFDNPDKKMEKNSEYVIYTKGINMESIKNIVGIDLNRTYCNDIISIYENFGIEAARNFIIRQIIVVLTSNGSETNYQHIEIFGDLMAHIGTLTSIDRHGLNKLDTDPLSRASFEKTVDQLITAAIFNEIDYMKSVSSRIMAGLCIKGGTGLCNLILDKDLLENSEYTNDIGQLYNKTYKDITSTIQTQEIDEDVFIPEM